MKKKTKTGAFSRKTDYLAVLALAVALLGGVPGLIEIWKYYQTISMKITFNKDNSVACFIDSPNRILHDKLAILLYELTITGAGSQPAYIRDVSVAVRINHKWVTGSHFRPTRITPKNFPDAPYIQLRHRRAPTPLNITGWNEFVPGQKGLQYGEPAIFSFAAYFDIKSTEFDRSDQLQITIRDYFGNEYQTTLTVPPSMKRTAKDIVLVQN